MYPQGRHPVPLQPGQSFKFTVLETLDRIKEEFQFLQAQYHSLKLECEKLASEKTEMQRHYIMYYEMSYGLNIEMHKQVRKTVLCIFFFSLSSHCQTGGCVCLTFCVEVAIIEWAGGGECVISHTQTLYASVSLCAGGFVLYFLVAVLFYVLCLVQSCCRTLYHIILYMCFYFSCHLLYMYIIRIKQHLFQVKFLC
uniref:Groucho/TLE N-terminal Q-rich domain-containing protein n=1 Tax=Lates calcarifer TaxID=8187 RepID=A0A4W6G619_LATCA